MKNIVLHTVPMIVRRIGKVFATLLLSALVCTLLVGDKIPSTLESVLQSGELLVISRNGPTTYYEGPHGLTGFDYEIADAFARYLGVELRIQEEENLALMINKVGAGKAHFAAAGLTVTPKRAEKVDFSQAYLQVTQQLVYRAGEKKPESVEDLIGKNIMVVANSSHSENLQRLRQQYPALRWKERSDVEMLDLLEMVHNGKIDYSIIDSNAYEINSPLYPKALVAFDISEPEQLAWAFPKSKDKSLYRQAEKFFDDIKVSGRIDATMDTFYGHLGEINYSGALLFTHRLKSRLPKWEQSLKQAAETNNLDWQLLAALSYQESHWNPKAKSPTGVRGFMMLTRGTAKDMGVKNRLDPEQSIVGGAKYFASIHSRIPERIQEPDRTWLALAAYNVGMGHLEDARILAEHDGANPDKWADVMNYLPLLAKRAYYKHTAHGYARGWEAVDYVQNIRNFHSIIAWYDVEKNRLQEIELAQQVEEADFDSFSPVVLEAVKSLSGSAL